MKTLTTKLKRTLLLLTAALGAWANPVFTLENPNISGNPGQSIGWGFSVIADPSNWISFTGSFLSGESNPALGIYEDRIGLQGGPMDFVLAPGSNSWIQNFTLLTGEGVGAYTLDPFAAIGAVNTGLLTVLYDVFSDNPNTCVDCYVGSNSLSANFSVSVSDVPEPSTLFSIGAGGVLLYLARGRRRDM